MKKIEIHTDGTVAGTALIVDGKVIGKIKYMNLEVDSEKVDVDLTIRQAVIEDGKIVDETIPLDLLSLIE